MTTIRLTAAQAMVRWLSLQQAEDGGRFIEGVWAIFGHGNVAGLGEALHAHKDTLPTWRGQNEQTMAHTAVAYAKAMGRRKAMAVTSSIGPGATNMVTAAAVAHVNRLPVLFIPGDVFASRAPDPVLQQIEDFDDATVSANDCFRPVVRYFDRISRPEHILTALPRALRVMTDPANCGPVCLAFCQDTQAEAYDYPIDFFQPRTWAIRRPEPDQRVRLATRGVCRASPELSTRLSVVAQQPAVFQQSIHVWITPAEIAVGLAPIDRVTTAIDPILQACGGGRIENIARLDEGCEAV